MGLVEMGYVDPTADLHVEGDCVDFDRFLADLESVAGTTDDKCEEFPTEPFRYILLVLHFLSSIAFQKRGLPLSAKR